MFNFGRKRAETEIMPQEVQARMGQGEELLVLDVREPAEYRETHVKGSKLIPLDQLALRINELPHEQPIVAMCRSGNRSGVATDLLKRAGFTDVANLKGGIVAWQKQGLPVERGP